nr:MAG TPA: hypothetical protein [Caudoviricetes sp.]
MLFVNYFQVQVFSQDFDDLFEHPLIMLLRKCQS